MKNSPQPQINGNNQVIQVTRAELFTGPLPHPDILAKYNSVVPGSAGRIISMAENQSAHRISLEKRVINSDIDNSKRGQIFGFIIALAGLVISFELILKGYQVAGTILGGTTLVSLVGVFVYGSKTRSAERQEKELEMKKVNLVDSTTRNVKGV